MTDISNAWLDNFLTCYDSVDKGLLPQLERTSLFVLSARRQRFRLLVMAVFNLQIIISIKPIFDFWCFGIMCIEVAKGVDTISSIKCFLWSAFSLLISWSDFKNVQLWVCSASWSIAKKILKEILKNLISPM